MNEHFDEDINYFVLLHLKQKPIQHDSVVLICLFGQTSIKNKNLRFILVMKTSRHKTTDINRRLTSTKFQMLSLNRT